MHAVTCRVSLSSFYVLHMASYSSSGGDAESLVLIVFLYTRAHTSKKKKKKKLHWILELGHRKEEDVTYGIRAGSTRDLGSATAFVDLIRMITVANRAICVCAR
jgi:hypothetical protein